MTKTILTVFFLRHGVYTFQFQHNSNYICRDSRKSRQNIAETWQTFVKIARVTASSHGPKHH